MLACTLVLSSAADAHTPSLMICNAACTATALHHAAASQHNSMKRDFLIQTMHTCAQTCNVHSPHCHVRRKGLILAPAVFAYGQTGSGKTYTMGSAFTPGGNTQGVIPKVMDSIFQRISSSKDAEYTVRVGFVEIHKVA